MKKVFRGGLLLALVGMVALGCTAPGAPSPGAPPTPAVKETPVVQPTKATPQMAKIKFHLSTLSATFLNFYLGKEKGMFKDEGIDLEIITAKSTLAIPLLTSGEVDYTGMLSYSLYGGMKGIPVKAIMAHTQGPPWRLVGGQGVNTAQDVKGKTVAGTGPGSLGEYATARALEKLGLDPKKDVTFVGISDAAARYTALKSGAVGAAQLNPPFDLRAKEEGFKELSLIGEVVELPASGLGTTVKKLKDSPDEVKRFLRAILKSMTYVKEHSEESIQLLMKEFGSDRKEAQATYNDLVKLMNYDGTITDKAAVELAEAGKVMGQITERESKDPKMGYDLSLLQEVQKELKIR